MLKRVPAGSLRLGMFIHEPDGSWLDYPDWKTRFLLDDPGDLKKLQLSGVANFFIDTLRGADVEEEAKPSPLVVKPRAQAARPAQPSASPAPRLSVPRGPRCTVEEEFGRAGAIVQRAQATVVHVLNQARLGKAVDIDRTLPVIEEITQSIDRNASALVSFVRMKEANEYIHLHSVAVCALMINLGRQLLFEDHALAEIGTAGLLQDIGMLSVPKEVINKAGPLTPAEMAQVRQHPIRGAEMLAKSRDVSDVVLDVCTHHHERVDGHGYPSRLAGGRISLPARMATVCDVYDAMTSRRAYKEAEQPSEALAVMFASTGQFDESVLSAFIRSVGIYPIGSLVRLKSGNLAVVVEQNDEALTRPRVRLFYSILQSRRLPPRDIDLAGNTGEEILSREKPERWGFRSWNATWPQLLAGESLSSAA
jgi:HD-GYP domain-containing protein (c-di-GMP phosphodiesterase class II)